MRITFLFFFYIFCSQFTFSRDIKEKVYISSSLGNDNNDGSKKHPYKTISHLLERKRDNMIILLKRGDVFFESIRNLNNCDIKPYGKGESPIICGFRVLKDTTKWVQVDKNIWRLDLTDEKAFCGYKKGRLAEYSYNNVGCIYVPSEDKIFGHMVKDKSLLNQDGYFYTTDACQLDVANKEGIDNLYFYSKNSPKIYKDMCLSVGTSGISSLSNCSLSNIAVVGFGVHGICQLNHCIIKDCRVDIIGGAIQFGKCPWVRFGNGIEFYVSTKELGFSTISDCVISRTYDCGATIQGTNDNLAKAVNIVFENNQFVFCRQAFEHFMQCNDPEEKYVNCRFSNNFSYMTGENQFDSPEVRDAHVLSYELQDRTMNITNNVFYGGNYYFGNRKPKGMDDNVVYIFDNQYIHNPHFRSEMKILTPSNDLFATEYRKRTGDNSKIIVLKRNSKKELKLRKKMQNKIKYKEPELHLN